MLRTLLEGMLIGLLLVCLVLVPVKADTPKKDAKEPKERPILVMSLIDRSDSVKDLPIPDQMRSVVQATTMLARLSGRPVKFWLAFYSGAGIKVIGDDKGMPTAQHSKFLSETLQAWPAPSGATPTDAALIAAREVLAKCEPSDVYLLHFSDGAPNSGKPRPELFPELQKYMQTRFAEIDARDIPPRFKQELKDNLRRDWDDMNTDEGRRITPLVLKEELGACVNLASGFAGKNQKHRLRFVTLDFGGGIEALGEIHKAAGGTPKDHLIITKDKSILEGLQEVGLTEFPNLFQLPKHMIPADANKYKEEYTIRFPPDLAEAGAVFVQPKEPLPDQGKDFRFFAKVGGARVEFSPQPSGQDPFAILGLNNKNEAATFKLLFDQLPPDGKVQIEYESPNQNRAVPEVAIYVWFRLKRNLVPEFRPVNVPLEENAPFKVSPRNPVAFKGFVRLRENFERLEVERIEALLEHKRTGNETPLDLIEDAQQPSVFVTRDPVKLEDGEYHVVLTVTLSKDVKLSIRLEHHILCKTEQEWITIELDAPGIDPAERSIRNTEIDAGDLGDEATRRTVRAILRSAGMDYGLEVKLQILNLVDGKGQPLPPKLIRLARLRLFLRPGVPTPCDLIVELPDELGAIENGPCTAELLITRADTDEPLELRLHDPKLTGSPGTIRVLLKRPRVLVAAVRGFANELTAKKAGPELNIPVDIWQPLHRKVVFRVRHDSTIARTIRPDLRLPFRDGKGTPFKNVTLVRAEETASELEIPPGKEVSLVYDLEVPEGEHFSKLSGSLVLTGEGLIPVTIPVHVTRRSPLLAPRLRPVFLGLGGVLGLFCVIAFLGWRRERRHQSGVEADLTPAAGFGNVAVISAGKSGGYLDLDAGNFEMSRPGTKWGKAPRRLPLSECESTSQRGRLRLREQREDGEGQTLEVQHVSNADGEPCVRVVVLDAGPHAAALDRARRRWVRRLLLGVGFLAAAVAIYQTGMISLLQWLLDVGRLWTGLA